MTKQKLLELAAKAAGLEEAKLRIEFNQWNPLEDDGDALRLAVKLGIDIAKAQVDYWDKHSNDPYAATRRAITRAAAEIGKGMK
jgi:hypothetical protein